MPFLAFFRSSPLAATRSLAMLCFLLLVSSFAHSYSLPSFYEEKLGLAAYTPSDTTKKALLEINLLTVGEVHIVGNALSKISHQVPLGGKNNKDTLVRMIPTESGSAFISAGDKKGESHQKLRVDAPKKHNLLIHQLKGPFKASGLQGDIKGVIQEGNVSLVDVTGDVDLFTSKGDITLKAVQGSGNVGTKAGNVVLEDVDVSLYGFSQGGTVTRKVTSGYYLKRKKEKLLVTADKDDLQVVAPYGARLSTSSGHIEVIEAKDSLFLHTLDGNITLKGEGVVKASSLKGNIIATYTGTLQTAGEEIELVSEEGDITLYLPFTFSATILIDQQQTDENKGNYRLESDFEIGDSSKQAIKGIHNEISFYQTQIHKQIGSGTCQVRIRAINGNIYLKKRSI